MQNQNRNMEFDMGGKLIFSRERNFFRNDIHFFANEFVIAEKSNAGLKTIFYDT